MNKASLTGRLVRDIELRKTTTGKSSANFKIAVKRPGKDLPSDFIQIQAWERTADFMKNYVKQGDLIGVEGRISTRTYEDLHGQTHYVTEIIADRIELLAKKQGSTAPSEIPLPDEPPAVDDDFLPF